MKIQNSTTKLTQAVTHLYQRIRDAYGRYSWRQILLVGGASAVALLVVVQLLYPSGRLTPMATIHGVAVGWMTREQAAERLGDVYRHHTVALELGSTGESIQSPTLEQLGATADMARYLDSVSYPWYLRLVPTSLWWGQSVPDVAPDVQFSQQTDAYISDTLMPYCQKAPENASFKADGAQLVVVPASAGGTCEASGVTVAIKSIRPHLPSETRVTLPLKAVPADITDDMAQQLVDRVNARVKDGVPIRAGDQQSIAPASEVVHWLAPNVVDRLLDIAVEGDAVKQYLDKEIAPKVTVTPGTSQITTRDFDVVSRSDGAPGQALNFDQTYTNIREFVVAQADVAVAAVVAVAPREVYTRTYSSSDEGLSALLANFASDHPGSYAMTYIELDGQKRRAEHQGDKQFVTASTYKLFAAYSLLRRVDDGRESWDANAACFDKMIRLSENSCAEAFLQKFGLGIITREINDIGLKNSNFTQTGGPFTTSNDLALLLGQVQTGQNFSAVGRDRLLAAMGANVHRQGIPAGSSGHVADKVGFLDGLLHDAAIVYSPSGTYVLVVLSEGSSWANIASLTREIEKLR